MVPNLPDFLNDKGVKVEKLAIALYDYIALAKSQNLDVYKEQELAVEESKYFFFLLTGIHFRDATRWRNIQSDTLDDDSDEEE